MKHCLLLLFLFTAGYYLGQDTISYTLNFPSDEFVLNEAQLKTTDSLIRSIKADIAISKFYIRGHADNTGDSSYNVKLSEKRCLSLKKYLLKEGVKANRIFVEKFGAASPMESNATESGRAHNRRITLTIVTKYPSPDWDIKPQTYSLHSKRATMITTRNGCRISVPENAFELPNYMPVDAKVDLVVTEYNNPAYFIASGIPMSYNAAGKLFMYHSEEMLSVKAFYDSEPVFLKDSVKIQLSCKKIDSLKTGFYKFNLGEQKWFEDEPSVQTYTATVVKQRNEKPKVNEVVVVGSEEKPVNAAVHFTTDANPKTTEEPDSIPALKLDSAWITKTKIDTGGYRQLKKKEPEFDSLAYACPPNCCLAGFFIQLGKKLSERPLDLSGLDLSFHPLTERKANKTYLDAVLEQSEEKIGSKKYYHIRLIPKKVFLRKRAVMKFKYDKNKNPELKAFKKIKWIYRFKDNTDPYESFRSRTFHDVRIVYDSLTKKTLVKLEGKGQDIAITLKPKRSKKTMNEVIKRYQRIVTPRVLSVYSCFWAFHREFISKGDKKLSFVNWINHFNSDLGAIHARYDSLVRNRETYISGLHCMCAPPPCYDCIPCDSCSGGDTLVKKKLRRAGPDLILIIGLGLYNFDQVVPMEDVIEVKDPVFMDKNGRIIKPKETFLLLDGINGIIRQDKTFLLIAKYRNSIFVVDKSNRRYKLVLEKSENMRAHGNTFILEDITSETNTLEGLEKALLGK